MAAASKPKLIYFDIKVSLLTQPENGLIEID